MKPNVLLDQDYHMDFISPWINFKQITIILILVVFSVINGHAQESSNEFLKINESKSIMNNYDSLLVMRADSLKRIEAIRLYITPINIIKEEKKISNSNPPPVIPKNK